MRGAPRAGKVVAHRLLGDRGYAAVQTRYWRRRVRRLRYPFEFREEIEAAVKPGDIVLDVGANVGQYTALLSRLVPLYVQIQIYRAALESIAGFFGAQMMAMESASKNAGDMINRYTLQYNRARQAAITKELAEIVGGAEALKG